MSTAVFRVTGTSSLPSRGCFVVHGYLESGDVVPGCVVTAGPAHRPAFRAAISAIGGVRARAGDPPEVALVFRYLEVDDAARWPHHFAPGQVLAIPGHPVLHPCPCCGFRTLESPTRGSYDICESCGWEDDGQQFDDPDYRGGANAESLNEARAAFAASHPHLFPSPDG